MKTDLPRDKTAFLLKFIKPEYEDDFIQGKLYMNTLKYFIDLERESRVRGKGDALEASAVFTDVELTFKDPETGEVLLKGRAGRTNFHLNERIQSPVLCMYSVDKDVLRIVSEDENFINTIPQIDEVDLDTLLSDFGDNMLIIDPNEFANRVIKRCREINLSYRMGKVNYHDFNINYSNRVEKYFDLDSSDICFVKNNFFKKQNEFRILLGDIYTKEPYILDIGDISDIVTKFKISDFFSGGFEISFNKSNLGI